MKNCFINGDCFEYLPKFKKNSIDLLFTSIPDISQLKSKEEIEYYINFIEKFIDETISLIHKKGFFCFVQTDRKLKGRIFSKQDYIKKRMFKNGFILKEHKILIKNYVNYIDTFVLPYANILIFTKNGKISQKKKKGEFLKDVLIYPYKTSLGIMSPLFVDFIIEYLTEEKDFVVDPFAGSGIILKRANLLKRNYCGIELDKDIYNKYKDTLKNDNDLFKI